MGKWSEHTIEKWENTNINEEIEVVGKAFKKYFTVYIALIGGGIAVATSSKIPYVVGLGVFHAALGVINLAATGVWYHVKLGNLRIIYELRKDKN